MSDQILRDKTGRQIERGDILRVFHFIGRRNKRHYMYKQALGVKKIGSESEYMMISHLELDDKYYVERCDGRSLADYEIVQSIDAKFEERPRISAPPVSVDGLGGGDAPRLTQESAQ
jgi:hypothetical protein